MSVPPELFITVSVVHEFEILRFRKGIRPSIGGIFLIPTVAKISVKIVLELIKEHFERLKQGLWEN